MIFKKGGIVLEYSSIGDKKNQPIAYIGVGLEGSSVADSLLQTLAKTYYVYNIKLPGDGASYARRRDNTIPQLRDSIIDFFKKNHISCPLLMGSSYGGAVAVAIAQKIPVKKLVVHSTGELFPFWMKLLFSIIFSPHIIWKKYAQLWARLYAWQGWVRSEHLTQEQAYQVCVRWYNVIWFCFSNKHISAKTLIIHCTRDRLIPRSSFRKLCKIPTNHTLCLVNCAHCKALDSMQKNNFKEILDFMSSN